MRTLKKLLPIIEVVGWLLLTWVFFYLVLWMIAGPGMPPMWGWLSPTTFTIGSIIRVRIEQAVEKRREKKASEWNGNYWRDDDYS